MFAQRFSSPGLSMSYVSVPAAGLRRKASAAVISVDTYHADTAATVLGMGVSIINDISACSFDPALLDVLVQYKPGYVLMHSQGRTKSMPDNPGYT